MTDTSAPAGPAAPAGHLPGLKLRLPVLRRPPGWGVLDEPALRVRATQLYLASMQQVHLDANGTLDAPRSTSGPHANAALYAAPVFGLSAMHDTPPAPMVAAAAMATAGPLAPPLRPTKGSHWHLLPWMVLLGGAMVLAPWLIWAPLVGGICLGLLLLQTGMLRHWLSARTPDATSADGQTAFDAQAGGGSMEDVVEAVQGVGPRRLRFAHSGWMLAAALMLVAVQAAMLITTLELKSQEPTAIAREIRAAQSGRDGRQGVPASLQQDEPPLQLRSAETASPPPADEPAGPAETRRSGAP